MLSDAVSVCASGRSSRARAMALGNSTSVTTLVASLLHRNNSTSTASDSVSRTSSLSSAEVSTWRMPLDGAWAAQRLPCPPRDSSPRAARSAFVPASVIGPVNGPRSASTSRAFVWRAADAPHVDVFRVVVVSLLVSRCGAAWPCLDLTARPSRNLRSQDGICRTGPPQPVRRSDHARSRGGGRGGLTAGPTRVHRSAEDGRRLARAASPRGQCCTSRARDRAGKEHAGNNPALS